MRKSIAIAAAMTVGAGASAVGATTYTVPDPFYGSDTLTHVTEDSLNQGLTSGLGADYLPAGSGTGQNEMLGSSLNAAHQQTAPMSKMMTTGICTAYGGTAGSNAKGANGIAIGLDAVDILSSDLTGGATACNGTPNSNGVGSGTGLAYSVTTAMSGASVLNGTGNAQAPNWKWVLALLYGGLDYSNPGTLAECDSAARANLVANWSLLFQDTNSCSTVFAGTGGNLAGVCGDNFHNNGTSNVLWHAFRRDDASGTSDVFSSLLGITTQYPSVSLSGNQGFGASPYCNALNWDSTTANNGGTFCNLGPDDQFVGPGGVVDPNSACTFNGFQSGAAAESCGAAGSAGATGHRMPPAGTWGNTPILNNSNKPVGGTSNFDVLPTSFQDNDPLRRTCLGGLTGHPFTAGEEVCNLDGKLGVVLSIPASDFIVSAIQQPSGMTQYPQVACNNYLTGKSINVFNCAPWGVASTGQPAYHTGECPNGDALVGGGCVTPIANPTTANGLTAATSQCLATKASLAPLHARNFATPPDGRAFNLAMRDGDTVTPLMIKETIYEGKAGSIGGNATSATPIIDFFGGMGRIHTVATIWNDGNETSTASFALTNPPNVGCQLTDATDQIGCLTQADPCSIGYAGDGAKTWAERMPASACANITSVGGAGSAPAVCAATGSSNVANVDSIMLDQTYPEANTVAALGAQQNEYPTARKLYLNSAAGFANLTAGASGATDTTNGEIELAVQESTTSFITTILDNDGFFPMSNSAFTGTASASWASAPFCEDFNEQMLCGSGTDNIDGCNATDAVNPSTPCTATNCPSAGGTNGGVIASNSTVAGVAPPGSICGNSTQEAFEECDNGLSNGTSGNNCSNTCRCANGYSYRSVSGGTFQCQ